MQTTIITFGPGASCELTDHPHAVADAKIGIVTLCVRRVTGRQQVTYHAYYAIGDKVYQPSRCWDAPQDAADWAVSDARETLNQTLAFAAGRAP